MGGHDGVAVGKDDGDAGIGWLAVEMGSKHVDVMPSAAAVEDALGGWKKSGRG